MAIIAQCYPHFTQILFILATLLLFPVNSLWQFDFSVSSVSVKKVWDDFIGAYTANIGVVNNTSESCVTVSAVIKM